jgi:hypothetical protein
VGWAGHSFSQEPIMQTEVAATNPYDVHLSSLPEIEELERLEALLVNMLAKTQAELERLSPQEQA